MDRQVITAVNVFVAGYTHIGLAESFKTPALKQVKLTQKTAAGERSISTGAFESLDTDITFKALPKSIYDEISKLDEAELVFKQAYREGSETKSMEWVCKGGIDLEYEDSKEGEYLGVKISQKGLKKYTHEVNGKVEVNIDHENVICMVGGKDLLAETRNAVLS